MDKMCRGESTGQEAVESVRSPGSAPARCVSLGLLYPICARFLIVSSHLNLETIWPDFTLKFLPMNIFFSGNYSF